MTPSKIRNERRRLFSSFMNSLGIAAIAGAVVPFLAPGAPVDILVAFAYVFAGAYFHMIAHLALNRLEDEND